MAIQELINQCVVRFMQLEESLLDGSFDKALTDHIPASPALSKIQKISFQKIYKSKPVIKREIAGFEVLNGLLETFVPAILDICSETKLTWYKQSLLKLLPTDVEDELMVKKPMYESLLLLLDFISGITDSYALSLYRNIKGISLPNG